jgi:alanyl-tRNA synthetase
MISHSKLRELFKQYWEQRGHKEVFPAPLVLQNDPTTLFTSSGMQQLVPFLAGETHPLGKRLFDIQPSFRAVDIDEVGNNRHTTFFEMMGNWSLGDYFKEEQLPWIWEFFTKVVGLPSEKLYVTVYEGGGEIPRDEVSSTIWKKIGVKDDHIFYYPATKNWWSRAGTPDQMPKGEIGGPDSEVFYEFTNVKHNPSYGKKCHPNCDCGRFLEIGNSVFIQYQKKEDGTLTELPQKNVDYGGGLERILMAANNDPDIFKIDVFSSIIRIIEEISGKSYDHENKEKMRIIADHMKGATFLIADGVIPSNKMQGYMLRRLIRRSAVKLHQLKKQPINPQDLVAISQEVIEIYKDIYFEESQKSVIPDVVADEVIRFNKSLEKGLHEISKLQTSSCRA